MDKIELFTIIFIAFAILFSLGFYFYKQGPGVDQFVDFLKNNYVFVIALFIIVLVLFLVLFLLSRSGKHKIKKIEQKKGDVEKVKTVKPLVKKIEAKTEQKQKKSKKYKFLFIIIPIVLILLTVLILYFLKPDLFSKASVSRLFLDLSLRKVLIISAVVIGVVLIFVFLLFLKDRKKTKHKIKKIEQKKGDVEKVKTVKPLVQKLEKSGTKEEKIKDKKLAKENAKKLAAELEKTRRKKKIKLIILIAVIVLAVLIALGIFLYNISDSFKSFSDKILLFFSNLYVKIVLISLGVLIFAVIFTILYVRATKARKIRENQVKISYNYLKSRIDKSSTEIDLFYELLKKETKLGISFASKLFAVKKDVAMDWAKIFEDHHLASIRYPLFAGAEIEFRGKKDLEDEKENK